MRRTILIAAVGTAAVGLAAARALTNQQPQQPLPEVVVYKSPT
jgi:hypothetical protein